MDRRTELNIIITDAIWTDRSILDLGSHRWCPFDSCLNRLHLDLLRELLQIRTFCAGCMIEGFNYLTGFR